PPPRGCLAIPHAALRETTATLCRVVLEPRHTKASRSEVVRDRCVAGSLDLGAFCLPALDQGRVEECARFFSRSSPKRTLAPLLSTRRCPRIEAVRCSTAVAPLVPARDLGLQRPAAEVSAFFGGLLRRWVGHRLRR